MGNINVVVVGHQFADPTMWVLYLANRFNTHTSMEVLREPDDRSLLVELTPENYHMVTKAPIHPLWTEEESYRMLLTQPADAVIYVQSVFTDFLHLIQRDFDIVSRLLAERPTYPPIFTLLNDIYCGKSCQRKLLSMNELNKYRIPGSQVFRTTIGYLPAVGNCSEGADEVFEALINSFNAITPKNAPCLY